MTHTITHSESIALQRACTAKGYTATLKGNGDTTLHRAGVWVATIYHVGFDAYVVGCGPFAPEPTLNAARRYLGV